MFASLRKGLKWDSSKSSESNKNKSSLILAASISLLEDILLWKNMWLSLCCIFCINIIFFIFIHWEINFLELIFCIFATVVSVDAFETWLKYKHRTACLKRFADSNGTELSTIVTNMKVWIRRRWMEYVYLRETNHTKAFLLINIFFSVMFLIGKYMSGYFLLYMLCMLLCLVHKIAPPVLHFAKKVQQNAESDGELEGLLPEVSDADIKILSIDPEPPAMDDRQSLDYWKPDDLPLGEASDSSDNSSSLVTNLSIQKMKTFDKEIETSDSSEDEYIPLEQQKEQLQSTLEVVQCSSTWGSSAYDALYNISGAVANMVYTPQKEKRKRVSSIDSSDGFEIIDKNDLN